MSKINLNEFRDGIFALRTRRFGKVAEIMIKKLFKLEDSRKSNYDLFDKNTGQKIEVKFATVMKKNTQTITDKNIIKQILETNISYRQIPYSDHKTSKFDCNIQQIKCKEYDILYYGLFFADKILIYKMTNKQTKTCKGYSDLQHRGNKGEGQFHITNQTLNEHEKYLIKELTYQELLDIIN